jgi:hypothetical protein
MLGAPMWDVAVERSKVLIADARAIRTDSLIIKVRAQRARRARSIIGSSDDLDAPLLASLIRDAVLCGDCLARKTGVPRWRVDDAARRIAEKVEITTEFGRCEACLRDAVVHRLG